MKIDLKKAMNLCTASEWKLVQESLPDAILALTPGQLKSKASAARKVLDKWKEHLRKQGGDVKNADAAGRTRNKVEIFVKVSAVYEKRLEKVARLAAEEKARRAKELLKKSRSAPGGRGKTPSDGTVRGGTPGKKKIGTPKKIQGHISSRNKRNQAKRDGV